MRAVRVVRIRAIPLGAGLTGSGTGSNGESVWTPLSEPFDGLVGSGRWSQDNAGGPIRGRWDLAATVRPALGGHRRCAGAPGCGDCGRRVRVVRRRVRVSVEPYAGVLRGADARRVRRRRVASGHRAHRSRRPDDDGAAAGGPRDAHDGAGPARRRPADRGDAALLARREPVLAARLLPARGLPGARTELRFHRLRGGRGRVRVPRRRARRPDAGVLHRAERRQVQQRRRPAGPSGRARGRTRRGRPRPRGGRRKAAGSDELHHPWQRTCWR
jgi:hypothetical protein